MFDFNIAHQEICIRYGIIKQSHLQEELQNLTGGTLNDVELIQYKFVFPPITGKLQKIKIHEKLTNFGNFDEIKVKKSPLFSIFWHLCNQISAPDHLFISLVGNRSQKNGKINKNLSFTNGLSPSVLSHGLESYREMLYTQTHVLTFTLKILQPHIVE